MCEPCYMTVGRPPLVPEEQEQEPECVLALLLMAWEPGGLGFPNIFRYIYLYM